MAEQFYQFMDMKAAQWRTEVAARLPRFLMDWLYREDGLDRLEHHMWMLSRPAFRDYAAGSMRLLLDARDAVFVQKLAHYTDQQAVQARNFLRRLRRRDGEPVALFLFANACELIGATPCCAFQNAQLQQWQDAARQEVAPPPFYNALNIVTNVLIDTVILITVYLPYDGLLSVAPHAAERWDSNRDGLLENVNVLHSQLARLRAHGPTGRSYHESKSH
jgi:hypothetical protein